MKIAASRAAFAAVCPGESWTVLAYDIDPGVSSQPMSNAETICGARNRAVGALAAGDVDYGVGIESGLCDIEGAWFSTGCVVVLDRAGREGLFSSLLRPVPPRSMELVRQGMEVGHANDRVFGAEHSKQGTGLIGLLTNDVPTREGVFRDAVISALSRFLHPELF